MYHADAFLSGHIYDLYGNPVPHVDLHAFTIGSTLEFHTESGTEFGGFYEMPLIGGYTWVVEVFFPEFRDSTALTDTIEVVSGSIVVKDYTLTLLSTIGPRDGENLPVDYALHQNYPNPFNPTTTLRFDLPHAAEVVLVVYDLLGREVLRLKEEYLESGYHQAVWNGRDRRGRQAPSGVYIARLLVPPTAGVTVGYEKSIKLLLLR